MSAVTLVRTAAAPTTTGPAKVAAHALLGFVLGVLAALVPAGFVTYVLRTQLPLAATVLHGSAALVVAAFLALCTGLAVAVCCAARAAHT
jgi:hypothetical protein